MIPERGPIAHLAIGLAVLLTSLSVGPMLSDDTYLASVVLLVAVATMVGVVGTLTRLAATLTVALQGLAMLLVLFWQALLVPGHDSGVMTRMFLVLNSGVQFLQDNAIPLSGDPNLVWLILLVVAVSHLTVEVLATGLEQPAWSLAPLLMLYGISAVVLVDDVPTRYFWGLALGYVMILVATSHFGGAAPESGLRAAVLQLARWLLGLAVGAIAITLALLLATLVPLGSKIPWLSAGSQAPLELSDPTVALNENLHRPEEQPVLRYTSSTDESVYLRMVALTRLTVDGASLVPMNLENSGLAEAYQNTGSELTVEVSINYASEYLPVPFAVDNFSARGDWSYDAETLSIVASGEDRTGQTVELDYEASATVPSPTSDEVDALMAGSDPAGEETLRVPEGLDERVAETTRSITADATTDGQKAKAIQDYLRSELFTYSLDAPQEAGLDALSAFILTDHTGYCIHFAAAMMTMARLEGIPARMAIGFTGGDRNEDGSYSVTTHNMHSWPELYFEGIGWLPFEPTKSVASPPSYTDPDAEPAPDASTSPSPSSSPTSEPSPSAEPSAVASPEATAEESADGWGGLGLLIALLVISILLATPSLIRLGLRRWRLQPGASPGQTAQRSWREVEATFADLGLGWSHKSPGPAAEELAVELPAAAGSTLREIGHRTELVYYAAQESAADDLPALVADLRHDLLREMPRSKQLIASLAPRSLLPGSP